MEVKLPQARTVDFYAAQVTRFTQKRDSKSSRRSCFSVTRLPLLSFWAGNIGPRVRFRFDLISAATAATVYYAVCEHRLSALASLPGGRRPLSKGIGVIVTQSAYCTDKQTRLIQPEQRHQTEVKAPPPSEN